MIYTSLKEDYLEKHQYRVSLYARQIAKRLSPGLIEIVSFAAAVHDVGKKNIDESILFKPDRLNKDEWELMRRHPLIGASMIMSKMVKFSNSNKLKPSTIALAVLQHHERWDGSGYPDGLKGDDISLLARIIAVADAFDAMTTDRPYKKALSNEDAVKEIIRCSGTQFDPFITEIFFNEQAHILAR
ncbi:HD-GYP domain-containing protein [Desulfotruncus alcoholivorax]|uniref:HD-GYP domain-containing protein n=1 Tax=Desulfotruncus alcoholivorax TaxID=265477 RepID=UPI000427128F|nr:HD-GYP domain-containing protein [Desulfotruncus alcoholivorax]